MLTYTERVRETFVAAADNTNELCKLPTLSYTSPMRSAASSFARNPAFKLNTNIVVSRSACWRVEQYASIRFISASFSVFACRIAAFKLNKYM